MSAKTTFDELLATAGNGDLEELQARKNSLDQEKADLLFKLAEVTLQIRELDAAIMVPTRNAVRAAELLNVEVPAQYKVSAPKGKSPEGRKRSVGTYRWEPQPLPDSGRTEDLTPRVMELSRGLWAYTRASGGSAGRNGEGVVSVGEFRDLLQAQAGKGELEPGESTCMKFANGRTVKLTRLAAEK